MSPVRLVLPENVNTLIQGALHLSNIQTLIFENQHNLISVSPDAFNGTFPLVKFFNTINQGDLSAGGEIVRTSVLTATPAAVFVYDGRVPCFSRGTRILGKDGAVIRIEDIRRGDWVEVYTPASPPPLTPSYRQVAATKSGYCPGLLVPSSAPLSAWYRAKSGTLVVTGGHFLLADAVSDAQAAEIAGLMGGGSGRLSLGDKWLVPACASEDMERVPGDALQGVGGEYFHFALESEDVDGKRRYGVCAEGAWVDTPPLARFEKLQFSGDGVPEK